MTHVVDRAYSSELHPHEPAGSSQGGQFAPAGSSQKQKAKPGHPAAHQKAKTHQHSDTLSYDPDSNHGTGYGMKGGDPRVHKLQQALNRLGLTDAHGKELADDGKLGPKTTAAVKKAQKRLGMRPDGHVTPALLARLAEAKSLPGRSSTMTDTCLRAFDFDTRAVTSDGRTLEGYAAVFNTASRIRDLQGDFDETILPGAFARSLRSRTPVLQFEHGKDPRIGAAPIGDIEELREDEHGLYVRARLYDHPDIERVRLAIAGRSIRGMSFRFGVADKGDTWTRRAGEPDLREIRDADVHELGPVVFPAYDTTSVSVRSLLAQLDPDEHRALVRELAAEVRLAADLTDLSGRPDARSAGGADPDTEPGNGAASPMHLRQRLDDGALRTRGILT